MQYNDETILQQLMSDIGKDSLRYLRTLLQWYKLNTAKFEETI